MRYYSKANKQKKPTHERMAGGVAQSVGPEFIPQNHKNKLSE
jgi:hypothetical protein